MIQRETTIYAPDSVVNAVTTSNDVVDGIRRRNPPYRKPKGARWAHREPKELRSSIRLVAVADRTWYEQYGNVRIQSAADIAKLLAPIAEQPQEEFWAVYLNGRHHVIATAHITTGGVNVAPLVPSQVFRPALVVNAASFAVCHNHPSGDPTPSEDDRALTDRLREAGLMLGVRMLDHVVLAKMPFGDVVHASFYDMGLM